MPDLPAGPVTATSSAPPASRWRRALWWLRREELLWRTAVCAILVALSFFRVRLGGLDPGVFAALLGGYPYFWTALQGLRRLDTTVGFLVSAATLAALAIGEYYAAGHVVLIMMLGELIEERTLRRTERSFAELLQLFPERAAVRRGGVEREVRPEEVRPGEVVLVRLGERVPVDGVVMSGGAAVDERHITGESVPKEAAPGSEVFAGSVALDGYLEIEARQTGGETSLAHMVRLLHEAQKNKAPIQKAADRFARWFSPAVLLIAGIVYFLTDDVLRALTILVVACPCAMCVATPTAVAAGLGAGAKRGLLIKAGRALETLGRVDTVLFDKTGTLTLGELRLAGVALVPGERRGAEELLSLAARAEGGSPHPVARALRVAAAPGREERSELCLEGFRSLPGGGVAARVGGEEVLVGPRAVLAAAGGGNAAGSQETGAEDLWLQASRDGAVACGVAVGGKLSAVLRFTDEPRPGLAGLMGELRESGVRWIEMVSGDRRAVAEAVAGGLGLDRTTAELRPQEKVERVRALRAEGRRVAVVGDGVNDAPALAASDVGLAMGGSGTALAAEAAEVVLGGDAVERLPEALELGRKVLWTIKVNLALSVLVNAAAILLSALGYVKPIGGALIHNAGSVAVVVHSASILGWKPRRQRRGGRREGRGGRQESRRPQEASPVVAAALLACLGGIGLAGLLAGLLPAPAEAHILPLVRNVHLKVGSLADFGPLTPYTLPRDERADEALAAFFLVYDTLVAKDGTGEVRPWVAEQFAWKDPQMLELVLAPKEKVQWQDTGEAVTAEDVAVTVEVFRKWPHPVFTPVARRIARVEETGPGRVRLTLVGPGAASGAGQGAGADKGEGFLSGLARLPLLPAHIWRKIADPGKVRQAVGCGPFRLRSYRPGEEYRFEGVEQYYLAEHRAAAITVMVRGKDGELADALLDGALHTTVQPLPKEHKARFEAPLPRLRGFRIHEAENGSYAFRATVFSDWHWADGTPLNRWSFLKLSVRDD